MRVLTGASGYRHCLRIWIVSSGYRHCLRILTGTLRYRHCLRIWIVPSGYRHCLRVLTGASGYRHCLRILTGTLRYRHCLRISVMILLYWRSCRIVLCFTARIWDCKRRIVIRRYSYIPRCFCIFCSSLRRVFYVGTLIRGLLLSLSYTCSIPNILCYYHLTRAKPFQKSTHISNTLFRTKCHCTIQDVQLLCC